MSDRLYVSYWLRGSEDAAMLRHFGKVLRLFPFSRLRPGALLTVCAVEISEPAVFERAFPETPEVSELLAAAQDFRSDDCAVEVEAAWDLWQYDGEWKLAPARARLTWFGPRFEREADEQLCIDFGLEDLFLPQPELAGSLAMIRSNIRSLLHLVREIGDSLPVERRLLWSESGGNFAERLQAALTA
ncbi:MAG: hypothetical protein HY822_20920 [Acidobacteria bacterium]|nr:hypothetical protein [Acidobacteriota bacterium]